MPYFDCNGVILSSSSPSSVVVTYLKVCRFWSNAALPRSCCSNSFGVGDRVVYLNWTRLSSMGVLTSVALASVTRVDSGLPIVLSIQLAPVSTLMKGAVLGSVVGQSVCKELILPPIRSLPSRITTFKPGFLSSRVLAVVSPLIPAPKMMTSYTISKIGGSCANVGLFKTNIHVANSTAPASRF